MVWFSSAASPRFRGVTRSIFAPAFTLLIGHSQLKNPGLTLRCRVLNSKIEAAPPEQEFIRKENGGASSNPILPADDTVTFDWFVSERYLPMRQGQWRPATAQKTTFEINKYLVEQFKGMPLRKIGTFEIQMLLNELAQKYSESIVKHAYVNIRSIMRTAQKLSFIVANPSEDTKMPETRAVNRATMTAEQIIKLIDAIKDPHDLCLMSIGLFCATRTSETLGLQWNMQPIPASVMSAINSRTKAILGDWEPKSPKVQHTTVPNGSKLVGTDSVSA